jgi:hypothetical protein
MKKIFISLLAFVFMTPLTAQNDTVPVPESPNTNQIIVPEAPPPPKPPDISFNAPDKTRISVGKSEIFIIEENGDTTRLQLGSKGMSIVEGDDGYTVNIIEMNDEDEKIEKRSLQKKKKKFSPHYGGFEIGLNNYLDPDFALHTGSFMDLNTAKSWNYNLNFLEYGIGLGTSYMGIVTGLGFEWSNYIFDANNSISKELNGNIISRPEPYEGITKSKLSTTYLTAPLLLEFQIPAGKHRIHISGGITGGIKLGSKTKIKYQDGGRQKEVKKDDYSLSPFRYGASVRLGYRSINLFANYYFSPLFGETNDPELYPFSLGLNLISF